MNTLAYFSAGAATWTLMEYSLHRFVGHEKKGSGDFAEKFLEEHIHHHAEKDYFSPSEEKIKASVPVVATAAAVASLLFGPRRGLAYAAGLTGGYAGYEALHRSLHVSEPKNAYSRWARKHHFSHHFSNPKANHGVTSPVWDMVFGTHEKIDQVRVPERHAMDWLMDEKGEIKPQFAADYALKNRRKKAGAKVDDTQAKADLEAALAGIAPE